MSGYIGFSEGEASYNAPANVIYANKVTNDVGTGTITKIELNITDAAPIGNVAMAIYDHNVGDNEPENLLVDAGGMTAVTGWNVIDGLSLATTLNDILWLAFNPQDSRNATWYLGSQLHHRDGNAYPGFTNPFESDGSGSTAYVMRAWVEIAAGGLLIPVAMHHYKLLRS